MVGSPDNWFISFKDAERSGPAEVLAWCASLPWIGQITKYHLAKNLGADVAKPDRWLERIAACGGETVHALCAPFQGYGRPDRHLDVVLWRSAAIGRR